MAIVTEREGVARLTRVVRPTESTGGLMPPLRPPAKREPPTRARQPAPRHRRREAHAQGAGGRRGGQGVPPGHGAVRHRRDRGHDGRARHGPRHDRKRVPVGLAPPPARAGLARALPDERDAPAQRALRDQRPVPRAAALRGPLRRPEAVAGRADVHLAGRPPAARGRARPPRLPGRRRPPRRRSRAVDRRGRVPRPPRRRAAAVLHRPVRHDAERSATAASRQRRPALAMRTSRARSTPGTAASRRTTLAAARKRRRGDARAVRPEHEQADARARVPIRSAPSAGAGSRP